MSTQNTDSNYLHYVQVFFKELHLHKRKVVLCFAIVSFVTLVVGMLYPQKYKSTSTIFADQQNIIKPLLEGKASVTKIRDRVRVVREVITSPRLLGQLVELEAIEDASPEALDRRVRALRQGVKVSGLGGNYIKISYVAGDPKEANQVVSNVTDLFINDSSERKRNESRDAFQFINQQVKNYKVQLQESDARLKTFSEQSTDGSEASVKSRISKLRTEVETIQLNLDEGITRVKSIESEMKSQNRFLDQRFKSDVYRSRVQSMQQQIEDLKLVYTETYPDIVSLRLQIEDLKLAIKESEAEDRSSTKSNRDTSESNVNPLYASLRSSLAAQKVEFKARERRLVATQVLLEEEYARLKRVAARKAELSELSRDYRVIKTIYEDMLGRKEKARLSMTLDVEGQGVTYKIQEPASYPSVSEGLQFYHFVLLGPLLGLLVPLGGLVVYLQVDSRVRLRDTLEVDLGVPVLSEIPYLSNPTERRQIRNEYIILIVSMFAVLTAYASIVLLKIGGLLL